ncbi:MAG: hypothetical protein A2666_05505 [Parcubacteria group bacterium RIFCSPHIGHO2_01_FULL_47_10b]|nr:MAG: hypothetical protein A2666_05505 [Parcubacteria group bacterium RIFCSPHIGHO2_01_FULL_47_10b]
MLFDDAVWLEQAQFEHCEYLKVLHAFGTEIVAFSDLLVESLEDNAKRQGLVDQIRQLHQACQLNHLDSDHSRRLLSIDQQTLAVTLISGKNPKTNEVFFDPLPNITFTRDIGAVVHSAIIDCSAAKKARMRESLLWRFIRSNHPEFSEIPSVFSVDQTIPNNQCTIEGGDIIVVNPETILIGSGERTTINTALEVAKNLLRAGEIKQVIVVRIPKERSSMHLDTLFSIISRNECIVYPPMISKKGGSKFSAFIIGNDHECNLAALEAEKPLMILDALQQVGIALCPILCGGNDEINQDREQWTDGANVFPLQQGVIVSYQRNTHTLKGLQGVGYRTISAREFYTTPTFWLRNEKKIVITIEDFELSRGRGGPRCLTFPLNRAS